MDESVSLSPAQGQTLVKVRGLRPNTKIFYFAANKAMASSKHLVKYDEAYKGLKNAGVANVDQDGNAEFAIQCPQIYTNEDGNVYPRHFHFKYIETGTNHDNIRMNDLMHTRQLFCEVALSDAKRLKYTILDARSKTAFTKEHIAGAVSAPSSARSLNDITHLLGSMATGVAILGSIKECEMLKSKLEKLGYMNVYRLTMPDA